MTFLLGRKQIQGVENKCHEKIQVAANAMLTNTFCFKLSDV